MGLKKRNKVTAEFNMSSLTDIIFLLLIFFMLTSSLVSPTAINLKLPNSTKSNTNQSTADPTIVTVNAKKVIKFNNKTVDIPALKNLLNQQITADGRPAEKITVILDIHPQVDAQTLVSVVDAMNDVGVKMILAAKID